MVTIDIDRIKAIYMEIRVFREADLKDIEFFENGEPVKVNPKLIEEWKYTGLSNLEFVMLGVYKQDQLWEDFEL
jgi:hypothetical protein